MNEKESLIEKLQSQQADVVTNLKLLKVVRREFSGFLSDLGFPEERTGDFLESETKDFVLFSKVEIDAWKLFVSRLRDEIKAVYAAVSDLQEMKSEITNMDTELKKHKLREADWMHQLDDEKNQNEKLWALLRQAEQEMERSTVQIHEMSSSMAILQQREHKATCNAESLDAELNQVKIDLERITAERTQGFKKMQADMSETSASLANAERLLSERTSQL